MKGGFQTRLNQAFRNIQDRAPIKKGEIATQLGVTPQSVSKWFSGKVRPDRNSFRELAKLLGVNPSYLEYGDDHEVAPHIEFTLKRSKITRSDLLRSLAEAEDEITQLKAELAQLKAQRQQEGSASE